MKIAVIAAMGKELALLEPLIEGRAERFGRLYGRIGAHDVVAARSGIGKVNAALAASALIDEFRPDLIVNTGVAGGVGRTRPLDVVVPAAVGYHDVWCGPGTLWGQADGCPRLFECRLLPGTRPEGVLASGDIFVSSRQEVDRILEVYPDAVAVDMESAAIAQTCSLRGVPFACIRVVSDTPGADDNIAQYETFWDDAPQATFDTLRRVLQAL